MATSDLQPQPPTEPTEPRRWRRDALASDIDDRVVVEVEEAEPVPWHQRDWDDSAAQRRPRLGDGWQIGLAIAGWPLWWALGLTNLVFPVLAIVLSYRLFRRGGIRLPPGFWVWGLFLVLVLVSVTAMDVEAANTVTADGAARYFAYALRLLNYVGVTAVLLYIGNATEESLPRRRVIGWLATLGLSAVLLGVLAVFFPDFGFPNPTAFLLPDAIADSRGDTRLAQVQPILGETTPRPSAPFAYTNAWGNNLSLLLIWIVAAWVAVGSRRQRVVTWVLLAVALVPIVYSLNRGVWIGLGIALAVVAVRFAMRGHSRLLAGLLLVVMAGAVVFALSPLSSLVNARIEAGHSNETRSSLASDAINGATSSPLIGFGSTRQTIGSDASIAIGPDEECPKCGGRDIGSTGQLWLVLIAQGFLGAALYVGFFLRSLWAYRSDHSVIGMAGSLVVLLELFYSLFYTALTMPLVTTFCSIALLWRNQQLREASRVGSGP